MGERGFEYAVCERTNEWYWTVYEETRRADNKYTPVLFLSQSLSLSLSLPSLLPPPCFTHFRESPKIASAHPDRFIEFSIAQ